MHRSGAIAVVVAVVTIAALAGMAQTGRYTVRRGDTLSSIAARQLRTVDALAQANGISDPNRIFTGEVLTIPDASASTGSVVGIVDVRAGDTLSRIAGRAGVSSATLIAANGLAAPYYVYTGGRLLLGVRNGAATAKLVRCPAAGAKFMNDWGFFRSDTGLHQGNDMMAKRGTPIVAPVSGTVTQGVGTIGGNYFRLIGADGTMYYGAHLNSFGKKGKVKAGDVLGTVGNTGDADGGPTHLHFEIHPAGGAAVNRPKMPCTWSRALPDEKVPRRGLHRPRHVGDRRTGWRRQSVRSRPASCRSFVVRPGDTLSGIAARYGTTSGAIARANHLSNPNLVVIGTKLTIPAGGSAPGSSGLPAKLLAHPDRLALRPNFEHWAARYGVPPDLLEALCWVESGWQRTVVSRTGAIGIGQLEPATVDHVRLLIGLHLDPKNADDNIRMSARFLRFLLDGTGGDTSKTLAAYYQGLRSVRTGPILGETKQYVATVLRAPPFFR